MVLSSNVASIPCLDKHRGKKEKVFLLRSCNRDVECILLLLAFSQHTKTSWHYSLFFLIAFLYACMYMYMVITRLNRKKPAYLSPDLAPLVIRVASTENSAGFIGSCLFALKAPPSGYLGTFCCRVGFGFFPPFNRLP